MYTDAMRAFLAKPLIARLSTIDPNGYPHTVPIWFKMDGDDVLFITDRDTRKAQNAMANPKGSVSIGGEMGNGGWCMVRGELSVATDEGHIVTNAMVDRYMAGDAAAQTKEQWKDDDVVVIRLTPKIVNGSAD